MKVSKPTKAMFACDVLRWLLISHLVFGPAIDCCPDGWVQTSDGKSCSRIIINGTEVVFEDNKALCESLGASMVMLKSEEDNDILNAEISDVDGWNFWLGAEYVAVGSASSSDPFSYRWLDGTPFNYTKWGSGQPRLRLEGECNRITWTRDALDATFWQNNRCQGASQLCRQTSDQFFGYYLAKELAESLSTMESVAITSLSTHRTHNKSNAQFISTAAGNRFDTSVGIKCKTQFVLVFGSIPLVVLIHFR